MVDLMLFDPRPLLSSTEVNIKHLNVTRRLLVPFPTASQCKISPQYTQLYPIKTKSFIRLKTAANPDKIYGCPLLSAHSGADNVDHDWLLVIHNLANNTLHRSRFLERMQPRDAPITGKRPGSRPLVHQFLHGEAAERSSVQ
ncbi:uncharacterized protein TrAFT101_004079 [Trichoderma asperellum]|uniref:uncharacterized protein n=1 Tax=Trichoderma asperellum TaxID=101201 RepID=UPI00331B973B|nr:hypothetical protein TrAFT101_004079 [Trichoderma asperellum]